MKAALSNIIWVGLSAGLLILGFARCANVVPPSGGPKDSIPPIPVREVPPNYSTQFSEKEIEIEFNEFISLDKINEQFLSSPPFEEDPDIEERGKRVMVYFNDTLRDSTTYTLNFGNAIVDFRENNPLKNYRYVFSTGDLLDSLMVRGQVLGAFNLDPRENVVVMLYSRLKDSMPLQQLPDYVSRTDENGLFVLPNLAKQDYMIFALKDINNNYLYDSPEEEIGFTDSLVKFRQESFEVKDTIYKDTSGTQVADSMIIDTIRTRQVSRYVSDQFLLKTFQEDKGKQYLKSYQRPDPRKISFIFNRPVKDTFHFRFIDSLEHEDLFMPVITIKDTLTYWILDSAVYNREYLNFEVSYMTKDSLNQDTLQTDTVEFSYSFEQEEEDTLELKSNLSSGATAELDQRIRIHYPYPIQSLDTSGFCLWRKQDTLLFEEQIQLERDSTNMHQLYLNKRLRPDSKYKIVVLPNSIHSWYDHDFYHDSLDIEFSTRPKDYYGTLALDIDSVETDFIIQLVKPDDEGTVYKEQWFDETVEEAIRLNYLKPGEYLIRIIRDENSNKKWDTGDYLNHIQPEEVSFYPEKVEVRANWEMELKWTVDYNVFVKPKKE